MLIIRVLIGLMMLTLGRQVFWLFVAGVGFAIGAFLAFRYYPGQNEWMLILISLAAGLVGVVMAYAMQHFAVLVAGFLAGGYFSMVLMTNLGWQFQGFPWVVFIVGGAIAALFATAMFQWALIFLSSLVGATLIVQSVNYPLQTSAILFLFLLLLGIVAQALLLEPEPRRPFE